MDKLIFRFLLIVSLAGCTEHENGQADVENDEATPYKGEMNISCFVYRDINRNGIYDLADRPYSGLNFTLERPNQDPVYGRSNISGFANFKMSLNNADKPIARPGRYKVIAQPRGDWEVTSENIEQSLEITEMPGSPGGLIAAKTLEPLGIAPVLNVSGRVDSTSGPVLEEYRIRVQAPDGSSSEVDIGQDGDFSFPASPGQWRVALLSTDGTGSLREVLVENYPVIMSAFSLDKEYANPEQNGTTIGFDDLTDSDTLYEIPNGYGGLNWHNWISTHHKFYEGSGYINATVSGEYLAYNSSGHPASISSDGTFDLRGFYIGVAWPKAERSDLLITAWRDDDMTYQDRLRSSISGPVWFAADYKNITKIELSTEKYWQLVIDDLNYYSP